MLSKSKPSQEYPLTALSKSYQALQMRITSLEALEIILELNKLIGIDQILIREGYERYPKLEELQKGDNSYEKFQQFFVYMKKDMYLIETLYLKDNNNNQLTNEEALISYNFSLNKISISKFLRDEASFYQQVLEKYQQKINNSEDEIGIHSKKIYLFVKQLFQSKYTKIIHNFRNIENLSNFELEKQMESIIVQYGISNKEIDEKIIISNGFHINQDQILDFLTFWLKNQKNNNLFVLYARTQKRLSEQSQFLTHIKQDKKYIIKHPSQLTSQEIEIKTAEIKSLNNIKEEQLKQTPIKNEIKDQLIILESHGEKEKFEIIKTQQQYQLNKVHSHREARQQQKFKKQLKSLFQFGCKRRYSFHKNTTFQDIQHQSHLMTRQKFINFCLHFEIQDLIPIKILKQYFKSSAMNLRMINFEKFDQIMNKIKENSPKAMENFLNKNKYDHQEKMKQIKASGKLSNLGEQKLSKYKFALMPICGKDIESIKHELSDKKQLKAQKPMTKKILSKNQLYQKAMQRHHKSVLTKPNTSRIDIFQQTQQLKNKKFNPEVFLTINDEDDSDKIWDTYKAKIWKQQSRHIGLESILSRRFEAGQKVLQKFNSFNNLNSLQ